MSMLAVHVQQGGSPAPVAPTILCRPGEFQYGALPADVQIHCGADVEHSSSMYASGGLFFTAAALATSAAVNAHHRRKAEDLARPQWRPAGRFPMIVTSQRILLMTGQWVSYDFSRLVMIEPHPVNYTVLLHFESEYPIMLSGPWVPWATVVVCATLFGAPWPPGYVPPMAQAPVRPPAPPALPAQPAPPPALPPAPPPQQGA